MCAMLRSFRKSLLPVALVVGSALPVGFGLQAAEPEAGVDRLEASITAAEGVRAVKRLQHAYGHYLDEGRWADLSDLFTDEVTAQFGTEQISGKDNLRRFFMRRAGRNGEGLAAGQINTHLIMQPIVTLGVDGRSAKGTWHELALLGRYGKSANWLGGVYENEYLLDGGKWKISRVNYIEQYRGAYEEYGHRAPPKWNIPYHFQAAHVGVSVPEGAIAALVRAPASGTAAERFASVSRRTAVLRDETEVQNLQHAFGYYLDRKLWDDVADLFAAGGSLEFAQRGAYVGRERIRKALETFHGPTPLQHGELFDHLLFGTVVSVSADGTRAAARTVQLAQLGQTGEYAQWELGLYENEFVKEQGKWQLSSVRYFPRFNTDFDLGWATDARPAPVASKVFPPDRKAVAYASYPKLQSIGIHFAHPVTGRTARPVPGATVRVGAVNAARERNTASAAVSVTGTQQPETLRRQIAGVIGIDAVENLNSSYGYYIDESDWNGMADTYSVTQGAKELTGAGVYVGRERIRTALNLRGPAGGRSTDFFTIHQLIQPVIHVSEDGLRAKARLRLFQDGGNADGSSGSWIGGIYENTAVFENGEWKFGIQDLHHLFNASYRNGWGRAGGATLPVRGAAAQPAAASSATPAAAPARNTQGGGIAQGLGGARSPASWQSQFPPDRKIRARQYAFPEITEPAFHYVNPVSGRKPREMMPEYPAP